MKKTNFTIHSLARVACCWLPLLLLVLSSYTASAQCNLVCNDHVNASMPATNLSCEKTFEPDDFLENRNCPDSDYEVIIHHPYGTHSTGSGVGPDEVDRSHIGYTMVYSVKERLTGNSCWGYVTIEDKAPPIPMCKSRAVSCFQISELSKTINQIQDNCAQYGNKSTIISMSWQDWGCDVVPGYIGRVIRVIRNWDQWGNSGTCSDTLSVKRDSLEQVKCPELVELECKITCGSTVFTFKKKGPGVKEWVAADGTPTTGNYYPTPDLLLWLQANCSGGSGILSSDKVVPEIRDSVVVFDSYCTGPGSHASAPSSHYPETGVCIAAFCRYTDSCTAMWPVIGQFCKMTVGYTDEILEICPNGGGFKIRRQWRIADWCDNTDTVCVQYIKVADTKWPVISSTYDIKDAYASAHDCLAKVTIPWPGATDCSNYTATYLISYFDDNHPGKEVVLSNPIANPGGAVVYLPAVFGVNGERCHTIQITLTDMCFNRVTHNYEVCVVDNTPPTPVCDEYTQTTLDPATCWARIYAKDLDNGSRDNCCNTLHFAIAKMEDITDATDEWVDYWTEECNDYKGKGKSRYNAFLEDYINCFVFKDYIELTECSEGLPVVLRVYEACGVPRYDPHVFPCSPHDWYTYNTIPFCRAWHNYTFFHEDGAGTCEAKPDAEWCKDDWKDWFDDVEDEAVNPLGDNGQNSCHESPLYNTFYDGGINGEFFDKRDGVTDCEFYFSDPFDLPAETGTNGNAPGNTCSRFLYNDCMVIVKVDDKTPPVCDAPETLHWFCDDAGGEDPDSDYEYAWKLCGDYTYTNYHDPGNWADYTCEDKSGKAYNNIECVKENDGNLSDTLDGVGLAFGWYGCNIYGSAHDKKHGNDECETSKYYNRHHNEGQAENGGGSYSKNNWAPVYCHSWLCADADDNDGQIEAPSRFWTPVATKGKAKSSDLEDNEFNIWDNCTVPVVTVVVPDLDYIDNCGNGWIKRKWLINAGCGPQGSTYCEQKIITGHRSDFEVTFPEDTTVTCAFDEDFPLDAKGSPSPDATGRPHIIDDECELVGVNYTDVRYDVVPDACYKIVRTWTLIDWCKYDPNDHNRKPEVIVDDRLVADKKKRYCTYRNLKDEGDGYMTYTQIIRVIDEEDPTAGVIEDTTFCILDGYAGFPVDEPDVMCSVGAYKSPNFSATDNCTPDASISFRYEIDFLYTPTSGATGCDYPKTQALKSAKIDWTSGMRQKFVSVPANTLEVGVHRVYIIAEDNCGNEDTSCYDITVRDCKRPTPYCFAGVATVLMPSTGKVTVWAKDLNAGSYDNCTYKDDLHFSFDSLGLNQSMEFNCTHIGTQVVQIWVRDESGNSDFCEVNILIQNGSGNPCPPGGSGIAGTVAGKVATESTEPVEHVILESKSTNGVPTFKTDARGTYSFNNLPMKSSYTITPKRDDDPTNGVSTIDLVLIQKHILGVQGLNSAYKVVAADVDRSNDVTAVDLVELRKLILTVYDKLPNNTSWRFVPKTYAFASVNNPWGFPEKIDISNLTQNELNRDFVGIKVGDVNGTVVPHSLLGAETRGNGSSLKFRTEDRQLKLGEEAVVSFTAENFRNIEGYQFSLGLKGIELKGVVSGVLKVTENNFGMTKLGQGYLTTSWNESKGVNASNNEVLFSIWVKATKAINLSESLVINSKYTRAEAYNGTENLGVSLEVGTNAVAGYALHQNTPNPFKATTVISYELAKSETVTLKVTDVTGRIVRIYNQDGVKGYNQLKVNRNEVSGAGVLYYTIETKDYSATKKMILVD